LPIVVAYHLRCHHKHLHRVQPPCSALQRLRESKRHAWPAGSGCRVPHTQSSSRAKLSGMQQDAQWPQAVHRLHCSSVHVHIMHTICNEPETSLLCTGAYLAGRYHPGCFFVYAICSFTPWIPPRTSWLPRLEYLRTSEMHMMTYALEPRQRKHGISTRSSHPTCTLLCYAPRFFGKSVCIQILQSSVKATEWTRGWTRVGRANTPLEMLDGRRVGRLVNVDPVGLEAVGARAAARVSGCVAAQSIAAHKAQERALSHACQTNTLCLMHCSRIL